MAKAKISGASRLYYAAAAGAIAFFGYKSYKAWKKSQAGKDESARQKSQDVIDNIKREQAQTQAQNQAEYERRRAEAEARGIQNPQSFAAKVALIQAILGVAVDGKPGPVTLAEYQRRFGLDRGNISPLTVQYYLDKANRDKFFI
jgi:uncharacterized membrane protein YebE (DUF533 family)